MRRSAKRRQKAEDFVEQLVDTGMIDPWEADEHLEMQLNPPPGGSLAETLATYSSKPPRHGAPRKLWRMMMYPIVAEHLEQGETNVEIADFLLTSFNLAGGIGNITDFVSEVRNGKEF